MVKYHSEFKENLQNINRLVKTPNLMQELILENLKNFDKSDFKERQTQKFSQLIQSIENISQDSLKESYTLIYNQSCVLAVSALSAIIEKYFVNFTTSNWKRFKNNPKKINLSLEELGKYNLNLNNALGRIIMDKDNSIKFQDLQSTIRTFHNYFNRKIELDYKLMGNIIFYQQCRHVIVHKESIVDEEFLSRVSDFNLKTYVLGDRIKLELQDWLNIQKYFPLLLEIIVPKPALLEGWDGKTYYLDQDFKA